MNCYSKFITSHNAISKSGDGCIWKAISPFCYGGCDVIGHVRETSASGDGEQCWTGFKILNCPSP